MKTVTETPEAALRGTRSLFLSLALFSFFVNVLMLTGAPISASDAERIGLVNRVVPAADLLSEARRLAAALARQAPVAMRFIMSAVNKGLEMPFADAAVFEATLFGLVASTDDMREGTRAFLEKRKPRFEGK